MTIERSAIFRYAIPFVTPLRLTGRNLAERSGYVLALHGSDGSVGYGEIAPLPGLHRETPEEALVQTRQITGSLAGQVLPDVACEDGLTAFPVPHTLFPSVRTGVEMALLNLFAVHTGTTLPALLTSQPRTTVPLNGLLSGPVETIGRGVQQLLDEGYRTLKIKVGRLPVETEIAMVRHVRTTAGAGVTLRLDANRSWSWETAVGFGRAVAECGIDYIEEPLAEPEQLREFVRATGIPVALDESLAFGAPVPEIDPAYISALVLKPSVIGGIARTMRLVQLARERALDAVLSSAFDTGVALSVYACLAATANEREVACGLDTYKQLAYDLPVERFRATDGRVDTVLNWQHSLDLRPELLRPAIE